MSEPWWKVELTKHWGEGIFSDDTRRAAKTALGEIDRLEAEHRMLFELIMHDALLVERFNAAVERRIKERAAQS